MADDSSGAVLRPPSNGHPTSPKESATPREQSHDLTERVGDPCVAVMRPPPSSRRLLGCSPPSPATRSLHPTAAVVDFSDAVHDPGDRDTRPHRNGRRPLACGSLTRSTGTLTSRCGSTVLIDSDTRPYRRGPRPFGCGRWTLSDAASTAPDRCVDPTRQVVVLFGEVVRPCEGGAASPPERSTTLSVRSTTESIWSGHLIGEVRDHFDGRE